MESGTIKSSQIHVSSASPGKEMDKARLNCCKGESVGAWCPDKSDAHPWYQIDFNSAQAFGGLLFQHPARKDESKLPDTFMKSFALRYKSPFDSSNNWLTYNTVRRLINSSSPKDVLNKRFNSKSKFQSCSGIEENPEGPSPRKKAGGVEWVVD
ncbi:hypothetical protein FSP39_009694 [Pinctada imbricata]|uniref:F5/8 type C domain-containing protein n=1 Tax=Pinctada imbricata TaxID=66713 RepID=A0AA88Y336_PINIB|nr:hypothetical protein FSP39_009694 [Pinctada imbricata]